MLNVSPGKQTLRDKIAAAAVMESFKHVGKKEATGKNDGAFVEKVFGDATHGPWCAAFVLRCYEWSGHKLPVNFWECRSVARLYADLEDAGAKVLHEDMPRVGDFAFWLGSHAHAAARTSGHVGIVAAVGDSYVEIVEGNSSNAVQRRRYPVLTPAYPMAFARPSLLF